MMELLIPLKKVINLPATKLTVELSKMDKPKDNMNKRCKVRVSIPHLQPINISELDHNMYVAIDRAHRKIVRHVKKKQNRAIPHLRKAS